MRNIRGHRLSIKTDITAVAKAEAWPAGGGAGAGERAGASDELENAGATSTEVVAGAGASGEVVAAAGVSPELMAES